MKKIYIGTSGWYYPHWSENFYPEGISKDELLKYFAEKFNTVEINNTFFHVPRENAVKSWYERTPENFVFSVKASRFVTHIKRLHNLGDSLEIFLNSIFLLKEKLGPILYQLPPSMKKDAKKLDLFLRQLPKDKKNVIEFRHESWLDDEIFSILANCNTAYCVVSMPDFPAVFKRTADFVYIRMHGGKTFPGSEYSEKELKECAQWVRQFQKENADVYVYFNNDAEGYAVKNALALKEILA